MNMAEPNPVLDETKRHLLAFLQNVRSEHPQNEGQKRAMLARAFLCGAGIIMEMHDAGSGKAFVAEAERFTQMRNAADLMNGGGQKGLFRE
jgi:hypothetical protein